jgi:TATA-binding protein-associated factor
VVYIVQESKSVLVNQGRNLLIVMIFIFAGKTLQSSAIIGAASYERQTTFEKTKDPSDAPKASLVVCPATLVSHWPHEISKFVSSDVLKPVRVHGTPAERQSLYKTIEQMSVVVISYETLRSDIDILKKKEWLYIVLDEGHAIRNPTSKLAQAARELNGMHRLILSGTPVQNSVMEVWAMFEFLMPGYLGDRKDFNAKYGKSVERAKKSSKESTQAQASILALQALHKQVMPFILRRTKDQVLKDLPPKIIQDIICDPSKLQSMLLKDFDGNGIEETLKSIDTKSDTKGHVFQALHFLRKLCSHPLFVLNKDNEAHVEAVKACLGGSVPPNWEDAVKMLGQQLEHSPKLSALKELLTDCGIGLEDEGTRLKFSVASIFMII